MPRVGIVFVLGTLLAAQTPPALWGDPPVVGEPLALHLEGAPPRALFLAALSTTAGPTILPGLGTVALGADLAVFFGGRVDASGWAHIPLPSPTAPGLTLYFQALVLDPGSPGGMLFSTPLALTTRRARYVVADEGDAPGPGFPGVPGGVAAGTVGGGSPVTIPTGDFPERVVLARSGNRAYSISRYTSPGTLVILDLGAGQVVGRIPTAPYPRDLDLTADGRHGLVLCGGGTIPASFQVFDLTTARRLASFTLPADAFRVRACGAYRALVVTVTGSGYILDLPTLALAGPYDLAAGDPFLFDVWYPPSGGNSVYVTTGEPKPLFPIPPGPKPGHLVRLDLRQRAVTGRVQVGKHPAALREATLPGGTALVTLNRYSRDVTVVDRASLKVLTTVSLGLTNPYYLAVLPGSGLAAALEPGQAPIQKPPAGVSGKVEVVDLAAGRIQGRLSITADLQTDLAAFGGSFWLTNRFAGTLEAWRPDGRRVTSVRVGKTPLDVDVP